MVKQIKTGICLDMRRQVLFQINAKMSVLALTVNNNPFNESTKNLAKASGQKQKQQMNKVKEASEHK